MIHDFSNFLIKRNLIPFLPELEEPKEPETLKETEEPEQPQSSMVMGEDSPNHELVDSSSVIDILSGEPQETPEQKVKRVAKEINNGNYKAILELKNIKTVDVKVTKTLDTININIKLDQTNYNCKLSNSPEVEKFLKSNGYLPEVKQRNLFIRKPLLDIDETDTIDEKTIRANYANQRIESYKTELREYEGAEESFLELTRDIVAQYIENNLTKDDFSAKLDDISKQCVQEAVEKREAKEKAERESFAEQLLTSYSEKLKEYDDEGAGLAFIQRTSDFVAQYIENNLTKDDFSVKLDDISKQCVQEAVEKREAKEKAKRESFAEQLLASYSEKLKEYDDEGETFLEQAKEVIAKYIDNQISSEELENELTLIFEKNKKNKARKVVTNPDGSRTTTENINGVEQKTTTYPDGSYDIAIKNPDGTSNKKHYDNEGRIQNEINYDTEGNKTSSIEHKYTSKRFEASTHDIIFYDSEGNKTGSTRYRYFSNGPYDVETYDANGVLTSNVCHGKDGTVLYESTYEYIYDNNGNVKERLEYREDGKKTVIHTYYDQNGNEHSYEETLSKSDRSTCWMILQVGTSDSIYNAAAKSYGKNAALFLRMANKSYNEVPKNATKYTSYQDAPYSSFLQEFITKEITNQYGYHAEDVEGYYFNSQSDIAKAMASNSDLLAFVKKNEAKLRAGFTANSLSERMTMSFNKGDLYYAMHGAEIISSWTDDNGKLHLIICDTYDFNLNDNGTLSRIGCAAMKDGDLVPYFAMVEVVI